MFYPGSHQHKELNVCPHLNVKKEWKLYTRETRFEPAEYIGRATCLDCGETFEPEDTPEDAKVVESTV